MLWFGFCEKSDFSGFSRFSRFFLIFWKCRFGLGIYDFYSGWGRYAMIRLLCKSRFWKILIFFDFYESMIDVSPRYWKSSQETLFFKSISSIFLRKNQATTPPPPTDDLTNSCFFGFDYWGSHYIGLFHIHMQWQLKLN